ncbi:TPA: hypothetical protein ACVGKX_005141 [Pseudomonas aeruginosa]|uniref:hypothetical protein n=1 Tax=Pseudomonas aeruginosa TaxID=287 RepID=UPI0008A3F5C4|nr:hypothetical protein [Pseudomonas aeruginosa]MBX6349775.1 hypothetical protein [Pseudomonas aeruginosa]OFL13469.1 hypothetical protein HMPREF2789_00015 [Pseudomonas aeruginosa]HBO2532579.1 hypothetical protein [Pseudomonas aeruginosa]HEP7965927.1 hypothetical protein [Pseudomonas aeruginosa]
MREEFEAWHHAEFGYCVPEEEDPLAIGECVKRWRIWQASRAALRVELPAKRSYSMYATKHECHAFNDAIEKANEALQQAGIEVK